MAAGSPHPLFPDAGGAMPRFRHYGRPTAGELPRTLQRSCQEAQAAFLKAREDAVQAYGDTDEADRAAYTALKQKFEKRGDHWIAKTDSAA
jgi:ChaB